MNDIACYCCKYWGKEMDEYPCSQCTHNAIDHFKPMTNFERIKAMSVEELADFICDIYASNEHREIRVNGKWMHPEDVEEWLGDDRQCTTCRHFVGCEPSTGGICDEYEEEHQNA